MPLVDEEEGWPVDEIGNKFGVDSIGQSGGQKSGVIFGDDDDGKSGGNSVVMVSVEGKGVSVAVQSGHIGQTGGRYDGHFGGRIGGGHGL